MNTHFDALLVLNFCGFNREQIGLVGELVSEVGRFSSSGVHPVCNFYLASEASFPIDSAGDRNARRFFLSSAEETVLLAKLVDDVKALGLSVCCTPFDEDSLRTCQDLACDFLRMPAGMPDDWGLLEAVASVKKPVIVPGKPLSEDSLRRLRLFLQNRDIPHVFTSDACSAGVEVSLWPVFNTPQACNVGEAVALVERLAAAAGVPINSMSAEPSAANLLPGESCPEGRFARGVYAAKSLPAGATLTADDICLKLVAKTDQLLAKDLSKYSLFSLKSAIAKSSAIACSAVLEKRIQPDHLTEMPARVNKNRVCIAGVDCLHLQHEAHTRKKLLLFLHGGGFVSGSPESSLATAVQLALRTSLDVLLVGYRLAPQNPFPAARNDVVQVYRALLDSGYAGKDIGIWGESAGGGLALSFVQALLGTEEALPAAVVCSSPWADLTNCGESHSAEQNRVDILLKTEILNQNARDYAQQVALTDPGVSPLFGDFTHFPPLLLLVGDREILLSDAVRVAENVRCCKGTVALKVFEGMPHVFTSMTGVFESAKHALDLAGDFFRRYLGGAGCAP